MQDAASQPARVLVADDEPVIRETVGFNLRREGLDVVFAEDGPSALQAVLEQRPDVVVLDIMMPGMDGFEVSRRVRQESTVPILLLSARGEEIDRIVGLEMGADDFLVKPFAMRELVARVRAMLRRVRMTAVPPPVDDERAVESASTSPSNGDVLRAGDVEIDVPRRRVTVSGAEIELKPKEFDLFLYLARHPGIVLSRDALLREVWGYNYPVDTRTVDVHVRWLRKKIEQDPSEPSRIETMRGLGYRFVTHDD
jgi:DNA-binding response OmpR family regulator